MKHIYICLFLLLNAFIAKAQIVCNGYWGPNLVNQTFGQGNATDNWYGPLATYAPGVSTSTIFVGATGPTTGSLADGYSGLTKTSSPPGTGQGSNWINIGDHTGDANGLMMLINAPSTAQTIFFEYTMDNLCPNTTLKLSVWVLNVNSGLVLSSTCGANTQYPNLTLRIVDPITNAVIGTAPTGAVPLDSVWHQYAVIFNNGNNPSVKLQLINNSVGTGCGNDLAIDDITVQACIPISQILPKVDTLTCSNATINFNANVINSPYNPEEYQWQYSTDGGTTWQNQGAPTNVASYTFNTFGLPLGQYLIRYITGSTGTTGNLNCTSISDTTIVYVDSIPILEQFETICSGDTFDFYGQKLFNSGIYNATISGNGVRCDTNVVMHFTVIQRPQTIQMLDSIIACQYDSVAIETNTLPYNANYTYEWSPSNNLNSLTDPNIWFFADASRQYVLTVKVTENNITCALKDTINLIVNPGDFLQVPENNLSICPNDSITFNITGAQSYNWTPTDYLSNANSANPTFKPGMSTVYQLIGTSNKGCTDTQFINVTVHPGAVIELPENITLFTGENYYMQPSTNASFFNWFPNSGLNFTNISNPIINPTVDTRYFVTAKTEFGCEITDSVDVFVKESVINMPNAFNPNETTFNAKVRGIVDIESFEIFNRWGQKVFVTNDINKGWDGTFNGLPQPFGVYVYTISAKTKEGKSIKLTSNLTLIR